MAAIKIQNGYKYYGSKSKPQIVLNKLNMNVQPGTIYGLLGASGCGKTTLLSCIVGRRDLNDGEIRVLGEKPGIPGSRIGYMPQEIALVEQMSVKESIYYFGQIYGMSSERIHDKFKSLQKLLELPPSSQLIENCSGGQQRRVSFACALIHDPELLILDEPTVGLDPMLRERIWDFLVATTKQSKTAVVITTHYIEEAKQANCIGLMRNGILLAEDTPENVMIRFEVNSIEDAFLILSQRQVDNIIETDVTKVPAQEQEQIQVIQDSGLQAVDSTPNTIQNGGMSNGSTKNTKNSKSIKGPVKALLTKNCIKMYRNPNMVLFLFLLPVFSYGIFYVSIGKIDKDAKLGIINTESTCEDPNMVTVVNVNGTCYFNNISCRFITTIASTDFVKPVLYHNLEDAHRDAKKGYITGYIHIPGNFSNAMQARIEDGRYSDDYTVEQTTLTTRLDMGMGQISFFTEVTIIQHFQNFMKDILADCGLPTNLVSIPIDFKKPIYGSETVDLQHFMIPGFVMAMSFFINTMVTATIFIEERSDGIWDRTLIAGVSSNQLLWSHLFTQLVLTVAQNAEVVLVVAFTFTTHSQSSVTALVGLLFINSVCGMFFGLLLSVYCKTHTASSYICTGVFYVMIVICGLMSPLESMPAYLRTIALFTPFAIPAISARNIIEKGWEITNWGVYSGYLEIIVWILIFYVLCIVGLKRKM